MNLSTNSTPALDANTKVVVTKGCPARDVRKGDRMLVVEVIVGERRSARVRLQRANGSVISFYAQHINRLTEATVGMSDGNPMHRIEVRRA